MPEASELKTSRTWRWDVFNVRSGILWILSPILLVGCVGKQKATRTHCCGKVDGNEIK